MTENIHHYLFMGGESTNDFNQQMFKLGQQPTNWVSKGMRLRRDATVFYEANESARLFIVSELRKAHFNFSRFYRWELQDAINKILSNNRNRYLPDFDTFYLLMHLSLENVLKGIWLDKFPENIGFVKLPKALNTHDLVSLAGDIKLELSAQQKTILYKLAELFLGYSRYPIKQRSKQAADPRDLEFGEKPYDAVCINCLENPYAKDKEVLDALFTEYLKERIEVVFQHGHEQCFPRSAWRNNKHQFEPRILTVDESPNQSINLTGIKRVLKRWVTPRPAGYFTVRNQRTSKAWNTKRPRNPVPMNLRESSISVGISCPVPKTLNLRGCTVASGLTLAHMQKLSC